MSKLDPITPGEILLEEFLIPMGLSQYRLAKEIGVPAQRISEIVAGKRAITADTDLRLCRFFGLSNGYWLRAQAAHDTEVTERTLGPSLKKIKPWRRPNKALQPMLVPRTAELSVRHGQESRVEDGRGDMRTQGVAVTGSFRPDAGASICTIAPSPIPAHKVWVGPR